MRWPWSKPAKPDPPVPRCKKCGQHFGNPCPGNPYTAVLAIAPSIRYYVNVLTCKRCGFVFTQVTFDKK